MDDIPDDMKQPASQVASSDPSLTPAQILQNVARVYGAPDAAGNEVPNGLLYAAARDYVRSTLPEPESVPMPQVQAVAIQVVVALLRDKEANNGALPDILSGKFGPNFSQLIREFAAANSVR